jgi:glycosyltransferase involved in cell wall biosynthesis
MRVALIRGSLQRNWELPTYEFGPKHQVTLMTSRGARIGRHSPYFQVHRLPSPADLPARLGLGPRASGGIELTVGSLEYLAGLERTLAGYDIAHTVELFNPLCLQALAARDDGRCHRVVTTISENIPFKREPPLAARRARDSAARIDAFVAVSSRARVYLNSMGVPDDRIFEQQFGIDIELFAPATERRPGPPRILCVARLEPGKGVEDLVIAAGLLARRGVEVETTFVGDGPLRGRLLEIAGSMGIEERVDIRAVPYDAMPDIHRQADVFVLASGPTRNWREQFGFAVAEAMASGVPALVGASGSLPETVGRSDMLVAPHDPLGLADHLEALLGDENRMRELAVYGRERALARHDQRRVREQMLQLYEQVLDREPRLHSPSS